MRSNTKKTNRRTSARFEHLRRLFSNVFHMLRAWFCNGSSTFLTLRWSSEKQWYTLQNYLCLFETVCLSSTADRNTRVIATTSCSQKCDLFKINQGINQYYPYVHIFSRLFLYNLERGAYLANMDDRFLQRFKKCSSFSSGHVSPHSPTITMPSHRSGLGRTWSPDPNLGRGHAWLVGWDMAGWIGWNLSKTFQKRFIHCCKLFTAV